jgi:hypothetical protein
VRLKSIIGLCVLSLSALPTAANAQFREIPVKFTGVVANDVGSEIRIRQPDGSFAPYTGPAPAYPYNKGDQVTISFNALVPTRQFLNSPAYAGQIATDGLYRILVSGPNNGANSGYLGGTSFGAVVTPDVSGPINPGQNSGQPVGGRGITIVYDANKDDYSLEFPSGSFNFGSYDGPNLAYNSATNSISPCASLPANSPACDNFGTPRFSLTGDATQISTGNVRVADTQNATGGFFSLNFLGSWNLPTFGSGTGNPTDVPAPGALFLFAGGVAVLMRRQRKAKRA